MKHIAVFVKNRRGQLIVIRISVLLMEENLSSVAVDVFSVGAFRAHDGVNSFEARGGDLYRHCLAFGVHCWLHLRKTGAVGVVFAHTRIDGMSGPATTGADGRWIAWTWSCFVGGRLALIAVVSSGTVVTSVTAVSVLVTSLIERSAVSVLMTSIIERSAIAVVTVVAVVAVVAVVTVVTVVAVDAVVAVIAVVATVDVVVVALP